MTQIPFVFTTSLLAQATPAAPPGGLLGSPFVMMGLMVVMFYFLLIRPQQRQRKELQKRHIAHRAGNTAESQCKNRVIQKRGYNRRHNRLHVNAQETPDLPLDQRP